MVRVWQDVALCCFSGPGMDFHLSFPYLQTLAPPMQSILSRLQHYDYIKIVVFSDAIILKDRVEDWPLCDCLLAFFSEGFPLQKAVDYVRLRRPFVFNDLNIQFTLQDRSVAISVNWRVKRVISMGEFSMYIYLYCDGLWALHIP